MPARPGEHAPAARAAGRGYWRLAPVALLMYALAAVDRFRRSAQAAGLVNAVAINRLSRPAGGGAALAMNRWLAHHPVPAAAPGPAPRAHTSGRPAAQEHVMSLSHYQEHQLHRIETGLLRSDPQLTAMLGIFGKLSAGEAMPAWDQVPTRQQSIRRAAALTVTAATVAADAIGLLLRAVLTLVIAAGPRRRHRRPTPAPERTRRGRGAGGRPDAAGQD
jgi:hypothetical protein